MQYQQAFEDAIGHVLSHCQLDDAAQSRLWPEAMTREGVAYGQAERLEADGAATYYLAAAALLRMCDGDLGVPLATRIIYSARQRAREQQLAEDLQAALERIDAERREWIMANHELQGAELRLLRPVPGEPSQEDGFPVPHGWPALLDRLLDGAATAED
ncbi:MAG: hypothetical protein HRU51_09095 [Xanthomonadales bacterium]|nr:hypothetical protein [Xanthomonadales bacterium]